MQVESIFDIPSADATREEWSVDFELPQEWNIGVIVGPSGCGKTTIANELWGDNIVDSWNWSQNKTILDSFPKQMSIKEIVALLSSVGFSSPPSWLRPFHILSNGEQFRVNIARTLAEMPDLSVVDEFTSVVDRTVAQIGSAAIQKAVRQRNQKFIAVTCHYDVLDWLEPDWVYQPHTDEYHVGRYLHQRPSINLEVKCVHRSAWRIFRKHHYLNTELNNSARCFAAFIDDNPVAFLAVLHFPHPKSKNIKRGHRTVCLPDYQGIGIGNALSNYVGSVVTGLGYRYTSQTSHPAMIASRNRSKNWKMTSAPRRVAKHGRSSQIKSWKTQDKRNVASFEYVGAALETAEAERIWGS
jgi:ABC-type lipoprotein export system ATPase subunit